MRSGGGCACSHLRLTIGEGTGPVSSASFDPRGSRIVVAAHKTADVRDARTGVSVRLRGHDAAVTDARFSSDGMRVVTASKDRTARIWDARTGQTLAVLRGHRGPVTFAVFSRDGSRVLTASEDGRGGLWSMRTGKRIAFLPRDPASVTNAVFSRDGRRVVTTDGDGQLRVWDGHTGALRGVVRANALSKPVYSPSLSPDARLVAVASWDDARVWNTVTGRLVKFLPGNVYPGPEIWVHSTAFSDDGEFVVTAGVDGTARVWQVARLACDRRSPGPFRRGTHRRLQPGRNPDPDDGARPDCACLGRGHRRWHRRLAGTRPRHHECRVRPGWESRGDRDR